MGTVHTERPRRCANTPGPGDGEQDSAAQRTLATRSAVCSLPSKASEAATNRRSEMARTSTGGIVEKHTSRGTSFGIRFRVAGRRIY